MSHNWGTRNLGQWVPTLRSEPYSTINPTTTQLPKPFVVCVVGASRGIGAGIAESYAQAGATGLILASRRISGLEETAARCRSSASSPSSSAPEIEIVACDITSAPAVAALAERCKATFGRLDVVVINSGYSGPVILDITSNDPETAQNAINVNYMGTFFCAKYLIPLLLESENGAKAFVAVSSMAAGIVRGPIANAQYSVSKAAQLKLMENIHEQFHARGLVAYSVHPGAVRSEMAEETAPEEFLPFLTDSSLLCGAFCVWLTRKGAGLEWLSGRFVSAKWDVDELVARKEEVVEKDLFKLQIGC